MANETKEDSKARPDFSALRSFWPDALAQKQRIAFALVALIVASLATLALPIAVRRVIDVGFSGGEQQLANSYFALLIGVVAVLALASSFRFYLVMTVGERVVSQLRADVFAHLTRLAPAERTLRRKINPNLYTLADYQRRLREGQPFLLQVLQEPKLFVIGDELVLQSLDIGAP